MNLNLNKKIEETQKNLEKIFFCPVTYHEEDSCGREKNGIFTIKPRNPEKNIKNLDGLEKALCQGEPVNFQIENSDGKLVKESKEEFINWIEEEKNVKVPSKESLVYGVKGNIDGLTYFTERKNKDGVVKESYYEPRSEEDKNRIREKWRKNREEQEKVQMEDSSNSNKKDQQSEKETKQQSLSQTSDDKDNSKNVYYGIGVVSLVLLLMSAVVVSIKKKKLK